jgi:predicted metal-binding protein
MRGNKMEKVSDEKQLATLVTLAIQHGASRASFIKASDIVVDERVRLKCMVPRCNHYGDLVCPPNLPPVDEVRKIISRYKAGIVLAVEHKNPPKPRSLQESSSVEHELHKKTRQLSKILLTLEGNALSSGYRFATGFSAGSCTYCDKCVGISGECKHPFSARPSMEGMGIDVVGTLENIGIKLEFPVTDKIEWWGLLLVD